MHNTQLTDQSSHSEIIIAPETLFQISSFPVTNTLVTSLAVSIILITIAILATRRLKPVPGRMQALIELIIDTIYTLTHDLAHSRTAAFFPFVATFFLYIILANWMGLLPGFGTVGLNITSDGHNSYTPILRAATSDLNVTLALALVSAVATHIFAIRYLGIKSYFGKWFSFNLILLFVGLLEVVSEFTKVFSLSFRLFGNIFAGEEVLKTVSGLFAFIAPLPFYFLEIIVGFVQAAVFMMLTLVFMVLLSEKHSEH